MRVNPYLYKTVSYDKSKRVLTKDDYVYMRDLLETVLVQLQESDLNQDLVEQTVAQDPRPAYQNIPDRLYYMQISGYEVQFKIDGKQAEIVFLTK